MGLTASCLFPCTTCTAGKSNCTRTQGLRIEDAAACLQAHKHTLALQAAIVGGGDYNDAQRAVHMHQISISQWACALRAEHNTTSHPLNTAWGEAVGASANVTANAQAGNWMRVAGHHGSKQQQ